VAKLFSLNPATEEVIQEFEEISDADVQVGLSLAEAAFLKWKHSDFSERSKLFKRLSAELLADKERLAQIITLEMGKPIKDSYAEIEKCASACEFYADNSEKFLADEAVKTDASSTYISFEPLGVILLVMPWNFPFWQALRCAIPTIIAGNTVILKHASNVPQCSLAIAELFTKAGFDEGIFQSLLITSRKVEQILRDPRIKGVALTGSDKAGAAVAAIAGSEIKKSVLELGGSDPFIVLAGADIVKAAEKAVDSRMRNAGQSCNSAKRFIVEKSVAQEFIDQFTLQLQLRQVGDPLDEKTNIGPVATQQGLADIESQVNRSVEMGAQVIHGGKRMVGKGYFYMPTIVTNVKKGMPLYDEETFGPVAGIIVVEDATEAVKVANDTVYGLGSSIWTNDMELARKIIPQIAAGNVYINEMVRSHYLMPYGGINKSGYGRELSHYGIKEFVNIKSVWIK
jgi:succinate-semialdehyde dehydrogenase/glutarate-semialdehyde dehydrogenase